MIDGHRAPPPVDKPACLQCAASQADPWRGLYDMTCLGCVARNLAHSPEAWSAVRSRTPGPLTARIRAVWGERYEVGRQAVWNWLQIIRSNPRTTDPSQPPERKP